MERRPFRSRSTWHFDQPAARIHAALADVGAYPRWWPAIRSVQPLADGGFTVLYGSAFCGPTGAGSLSCVVRFAEVDPDVREASLAGDLDGTVRWTVHDAVDRTYVVVDEELTFRRPAWFTGAGPLGRAVHFAHDLMMRQAERGLQAFLVRMRPGPDPT